MRQGIPRGVRLPPFVPIGFLALAATTLAVSLGTLELLRSTDARALDLALRLRHRLAKPSAVEPARSVHPGIVLVGIDDADVRTRGAMPWPRAAHAEVLSAFVNPAARPAAVGYDILFSTAKADPVGRRSDAIFAASIGAAGNVVLAGAARDAEHATASSADFTEADARWLDAQAVSAEGPPPPRPVFEPAPILPAKIFRPGAHLGLINAIRDEDGVHRLCPLLVGVRGRWVPSLTLRLAMMARGVGPTGVTLAPCGRELVLRDATGGELRVPLELRGRFLGLRVNYRGTLMQGDFTSTSFAGAVAWARGESDDVTLNRAMEVARGGVVVVAQVSTGSDIGATPIVCGTALVDTHLNAVNDLLRGDFLRVASQWVSWLMALVLAGVAAWATRRLSAVGAALLLAAALAAVGVAGGWGFVAKSVWIPPVVPLLALAFAWGVGTALRFMGEERAKRELRRTFQNYLSPKVLDEVLENPDSARLGGTRRELTVLFTDVRGFTSFCEKHEPELVVHVLNRILEVVSEIVLRHEGTLDKYIGDAVMAFWGAPGPGRPDHAAQAVRAAIEMREALARLRTELEAQGLPSLHLGVGVNTGAVLVGNVGSSHFRNYTVIGDEVNLAARLEPLTRTYGCDIIISESTATAIGSGFRTRFLGEVPVKGKSVAVKVYALDGVA